MTEFLLVFALAIGLGWPLGRYLAAVMRGTPMHGDRLFLWLERPLYALIGTNPERGMSWRGYAGAFLLSNLVLAVIVWLILMTQAWLPLNPNGAPNMSWDLALHTMVSFLTNTNQQHYSGQAQLSYLAHMTGIVTLQVITPMMGLALVVATLRGFFGGRHAQARKAVGPGGCRQLLGRRDPPHTLASCCRCAPLRSVLLARLEVPATGGRPCGRSRGYDGRNEGAEDPAGSVSPMVAIKQLGTNGGGWYGPNSSVPLAYAAAQPARSWRFCWSGSRWFMIRRPDRAA